jgi:hypothetical protein
MLNKEQSVQVPLVGIPIKSERCDASKAQFIFISLVHKNQLAIGNKQSSTTNYKPAYLQAG